MLQNGKQERKTLTTAITCTHLFRYVNCRAGTERP